MAEIKRVVCDDCGNDGATTYAIAQRPNTPWMIDLCEQCAAPIARWRDKGRRGPSRRAYRKYGKVDAQAR